MVKGDLLKRISKRRPPCIMVVIDFQAHATIRHVHRKNYINNLRIFLLCHGQLANHEH